MDKVIAVREIKSVDFYEGASPNHFVVIYPPDHDVYVEPGNAVVLNEDGLMIKP